MTAHEVVGGGVSNMRTNAGVAEVDDLREGAAFWFELELARSHVKAGRLSNAERVVRDLAFLLPDIKSSQWRNRWKILEKFVDTYKLDVNLGSAPANVARSGLSLDEYVTETSPGVSLVTCCKNRNENLIKAIPSWLACDDISEIVIVDWSSEVPVADDLARAGIEDVRIKIVRVEGEPRWVLTYAFNVGFRAASYDAVLKVDADIVLREDFFKKNFLESGEFISGDWRIAEEGQEYINGFFYVSREDLLDIKGFNEYITSYGWDDDDIYSRLEGAGLDRKRVDPNTLNHLPHDDAARVGGKGVSALCARDDLELDTKFRIRANRFIANVMPMWNSGKAMLRFTIEQMGLGYIRIRRQGEPRHVVPRSVRSDAYHYAAVDLLSWRLGPRAFELTKEQMQWLLSGKRFDDLVKLDLELALSGAAGYEGFRLARRYLLVKVASDVDISSAGVESSVGQLIRSYSHQYGLPLILFTDSSEIADDWATTIPCMKVHLHHAAGATQAITAEDLARVPDSHCHLFLEVNRSTLQQREALNSATGSNLAPLDSYKKKIYVDAQHGLGNRLRAIASAAAIADKTDRELVVVWEPDHHCECRFHDLFDYDGPVIEESFLPAAKRRGAITYNYMEIERGAKKDASVEVVDGKDLYARSAYVLKSKLTSWLEENEFLRSLKPKKSVLELIDRVRQPNELGVHVRMEAGEGLDHNTYDSQENWTKEGHEQLHYWREKSHYSRFMNRIDELDAKGEAGTIFLAADRPEIYEEFTKHYGDQVTFLPRNVYDRSREQIQYALADVILLSRCKKLLGSTWSSFSELALRLSENYEAIEMSGKDF